MMKGVVTVNSQEHVLQGRMEEAGIRHGQKVRVNLTGVRAYPLASPAFAEIRFCFMQPIEVIGGPLTRATPGPLPRMAALKNVFVPNYGQLAIRNALLWSNGHNTLILDRETSVEVIGELPKVLVVP